MELAGTVTLWLTVTGVPVPGGVIVAVDGAGLRAAAGVGHVGLDGERGTGQVGGVGLVHVRVADRERPVDL